MIQLNYLAFAIPAFFLFLYLEYRLALHLKKPEVFKYESSIANISIGIAERLLNLFISASFYSLFYWVYKNYALINIPNSWWVWVLLILTTDLVWYWYHRLGHQVNFLWAAHIVHHQSEEFNLTVSARITIFQALIRNIFWCLIPLLGFHPTMVIAILMVHGAYSFFTHTQLIGKLGWLEHIFITPSLHGVHHASDEKYLDKNYGDVFVFWDKLFGTFQREEETPKYGLTHPVKSYSFLWQHFHYYLEILEACKKEKSIKARLKIIFGNPATLDQNIRPILESRYLQQKAEPSYRFKFRTYLNFQLILCIALLSFVTAFYVELHFEDKLFTAAVILITLINCGALLEQRKWIYYLECFRLILLFAYAFWKFHIFELVILPVVILLILENVFRLSQLYRQYLLRYEEF
ncbi:Fatty acid hydroxylase superfamily protein [Pedobacter steynii]|uniref:Fatty acid hydroxylase superfamily protein n=1 Tax=Pedobacter steynii TaxID=430522 RepID=A0A1G9WED3_9SPHI|nr:sterol desaturase family protein [Pedobacter steynii]NQX40270.1 sterol desaturase family protein [Pedobacter steynii]SDM82830.1 Fatty acid hydroxylase superfamily protein [Pedobacter steynii]